MKDTAFSNGGFSGRQPTPPSVTSYATVDALEAAAEAGLSAGYYQVGEQIVYWDGTSFEPPLVRSVLRYGNDETVDSDSPNYIQPYPTDDVSTSNADWDFPTTSHASDIDTGSTWSAV